MVIIPVPLSLYQKVRHPQFPARGRKRLGRKPYRTTGNQVRHPQFPARGRKHKAEGRKKHIHLDVRHPQFPARGRKLAIFLREGCGSLSSDTLNSPQGDGNNTGRSKSPRPRRQCQTPSIPRKGTETNLGEGLRRDRAATDGPRSDTLNSPQGDGNVASTRAFPFLFLLVRHPQFPARGRKPSQVWRGCSLSRRQTPSIPRKGTETRSKF